MNDVLHAIQKEKIQKRFFVIISIMLSLFCVLKVLRGSDTDSTVAGGIWNYISLVYYPLFLFVFVLKKAYKVNIIFVSSLFYVILAVLSAFMNFSMQINVSSIYQFLMIPYAVLVFWTFYLCSEKSKTGERIILLGYFLCLILNIYTILRYRFAGAAQAMESDIYFSLGLFPFALQLLKNRRVKAIVIVLEFVAVFMVNKRTALISFGIALLVYWFINSWIKEKNKIGGIIKTMIITSMAIIVLWNVSKYIDDKYNMNIYSRLLKIVEDGGSGRIDIYKKIWIGFQNSSFKEKLFGHGMNTAGPIAGFGQAHNDFLEILYDYGIVAFGAVMIFFISLIFEMIHLIRKKSEYAATFACSMVIGLFLAMFSYFLIFYTYVTCIMAFWGYVLAMERKSVITKTRGISNEYCRKR